MDANDNRVLTRNIDLQLLRAFVAVAESGSMTAAARQLNVTQGAISQQIKRLEELLQKQMFARSGQGLIPTMDGERLFLHAQKLISMNDEVFSLMTAPEFAGVVRLGIPNDIVSPYAAPILKSFGAVYPKVRVELAIGTSEQLKKALTSGEINLTLTTERDTPKGAERLIRNDLVWVGAANGEVHTQNPLPVLLCNESCMFRPVMLAGLETAGRDWRLTAGTGNMDATFAMLQADLAVTALLESTVPAFLNVLDKRDGLPDLQEFFINLYKPASGVNEIAAELAQHIREQFSQWRRPQQMIAS